MGQFIRNRENTNVNNTKNIKNCYDTVNKNPYIEDINERKNLILTVSGTIEVFPESFDERQSFFENNMKL